MTSEDTSRVETIIVHNLAAKGAVDESVIDLDENLMTSGLIDSIGMMRLITELEEELSVKVPPPELVPENFKTVRLMAAYLAGLAAR